MRNNIRKVPSIDHQSTHQSTRPRFRNLLEQICHHLEKCEKNQSSRKTPILYNRHEPSLKKSCEMTRFGCSSSTHPPLTSKHQLRSPNQTCLPEKFRVYPDEPMTSQKVHTLKHNNLSLTNSSSIFIVRSTTHLIEVYDCPTKSLIERLVLNVEDLKTQTVEGERSQQHPGTHTFSEICFCE